MYLPIKKVKSSLERLAAASDKIPRCFPTLIKYGTSSQFRYLAVSECRAAEAILLTVCDFTLNSMTLEEDPQ